MYCEPAFMHTTHVCISVCNHLAHACFSFSSAPPAVSVSQTELVVSEGDEVRVQCEGTGVGVLTTRWFYNNEESSFQDGDNLVIPSVSSSHTGQYECRVSNIAATVTKTVQIDVKCEYAYIYVHIYIPDSSALIVHSHRV